MNRKPLEDYWWRNNFLFKYIFGPVHSRRLGHSLGIDILGGKICSFNCVYCEVRKTENLTSERKPYVKANDVIREIDLFFKTHPDIYLDYITFSGQGEPTLNSEIAVLIEYIKNHYPYKVCVLTNASLLNKEDVRTDLLNADLIIPSLDAVSKKAFRKVNLPEKSLDIDDIITGIKKLKEEFKGELWLEILFVEGINNNDDEIRLLEEKTRLIKPDKVCVNTIFRPPSFQSYKPVSNKRLDDIQKHFDTLIESEKPMEQEFDTQLGNDKHSWSLNEIEEQLKPMLHIRPCTFDDLTSIFSSHNSNIDENALKDFLDQLVDQQVLDIRHFDESPFYVLNKNS